MLLLIKHFLNSQKYKIASSDIEENKETNIPTDNKKKEGESNLLFSETY